MGWAKSFGLVGCEQPTLLAFNGVPEVDGAGMEDAGGEAAMAADGVVAAGAEFFFHAGAGMALAGDLEQRGADAQGLFLYRQQVEAGDDKVTAKARRVGRALAEIGADRGQMFVLDNGDLAGAGAAGVAVADQALVRIERGGIDGLDRAASGSAKANPDQAARLPGRTQQPGDDGGVIQGQL